jgi:hypothetical protein
MTALRAEKTQLRTDLDTAQTGASARDTLLPPRSRPTIMKNQLTGKTVALVSRPGADADLVKDTTASWSRRAPRWGRRHLDRRLG